MMGMNARTPTGCNATGQCVGTNKPQGTSCTHDAELCTDDFCDGQGNCVHPCAVGVWCSTPTVQRGVCIEAGSACPCSPVGRCCYGGGTCEETDEVSCVDFGGFFGGEDTFCFGDYNQDGIDDACGPEELCVAPDNGTGTVDLVADCPYVAPDEPMFIIEGLPPDSTLELNPVLTDYSNRIEQSGGTMGGNYHTFDAHLQLELTGTGYFEGYYRMLSVPVSAEIHTGPRNPGDPVQTFTAEVYRLYGELFGDPDFCSFRILAGEYYGLPSPGETTLTQLPSGDFAVDSFFDITYQIEFEGCPGSPLDDMWGMTTATVRWQQGVGFFLPGACCLADGTCTEVLAGECEGEFHGSGSICFGDYNDDGIDDACGPEELCVAPDNGAGTVDLVADCPYVAPEEPMYIIEGLPPGSSLELAPVLSDYSNRIELPGGVLGGDYHTFDSYLQLEVTGTGEFTGFHRTPLGAGVGGDSHGATESG